MDKDQGKIASGEQGHAATCGPSPATVCWAVATLLVKDEVIGSRRVVTRRVLASSCLAASKEEAIGAETVAMLAENEGFSLEAIVAAEAITPNPSHQGTTHLVRSTLDGVVGSLNKQEECK